jgi:hypothetical protein
VTLLEEMPVQETIDAAGDLVAAGFRLGTVIVNRARPTLVDAGLLDGDGGVDPAALGRALRGSGVAPALSGELAAQMARYAARQQLQSRTAAQLDVIRAPRITLPDLPAPIGLGELTELAGTFFAAPAEPVSA